MKRRPLFLAMAAVLGLTVASPTFAATAHKKDEVKALHSLIDKQQQQLNQQQQDLQMLRDSLKRLEGAQQQVQVQIQAQASAPPPAAKESSFKDQMAPTFSSGPGVSVAMHGWVSATAFHQDKSFIFGNGTNAEFPVPGSAGALSGIDVRNTRLWFDFTGSKFVGNWQGGGHIEVDFFGGFNGTGAFSGQMEIPRMRQAYLILQNPESGSKVIIGQQFNLTIGLDNVPASLTNLAFPLGYSAGGLIAWRFPGAVYMQDLNRGTTGPKWRLDLGAFSGDWSGPGSNVDYQTAGNVGFSPQLEARLHVEDKSWLAYAVVHYSKIDLRGVTGTSPTPIKPSFNSEAFVVGANWHPGAWMFKGSWYTGTGIGQLFGALTQFGDIQDTGGFFQAGYSFTPHWSADAFYGFSKPNNNDVITWMGQGSAGRLDNRQVAVSLNYIAGAYGFGLQWLNDKLQSTTNGVDRQTTSGNQLSVSAIYHF
ncbi:MAG: hypothetical protein EPN69_10765 [Rhodanobacter sp.]|nr:MAG: hypothetical protein EPN69_10765 [Rhodanobacter sp.]TAM40769.1 MAG: hypothetical protein EPN58_09490 [Rhodanobacter sp.]